MDRAFSPFSLLTSISKIFILVSLRFVHHIAKHWRVDFFNLQGNNLRAGAISQQIDHNQQVASVPDAGTFRNAGGTDG